ncbi:hypothetical protein JTE90_017224 [Oedothorax gibbosus]|uniref:Transglutaminase-like domain-containing protein n=1 Tax=Oedothorax gibbosus TaxID=931172 RepID=A0AAV6VE13_9ARAC|nr:hypothetical protein JTE90_017224 [Oedothorax gibbosus]
MGAACPSGFKGEFSPSHNNHETALPAEKITFGWRDVPMVDIDDSSSCSGMFEKNETAEKPIPLIVEDVELSSNCVDHHTSAFHGVHQGGSTVLRRGAPFRVELELNRPHDPAIDILCLVFTVTDADPPSYSQNTLVVLPVLKECRGDKIDPLALAEWRLRVLDSKSKTMVLEVVPSPVCVVGEWRLEVDSRSKVDCGDTPGFRFQVPEPMTILFNPWCTDDPVYVEEEERRLEYVLADTGIIWRGSHNCPRPCIWKYAQFEEKILDCCLHLLTKIGRLKIVDRADPVSVVRHMSAVLSQRGGIQEGKPDTFRGAGSQEMLLEFYKKKKPVKGAGHCWIRAGLFTTVCRALGIPSRPVTNFCSAHDTHDSRTVDRYFDVRGRPVDALNRDTLWTFHVWCETWMRRPDLEPGGYGGWQAVDCSREDRCGPASVCALSRGDLRKPFDAETFSAEVGSRLVYWRYDGPTSPLKLVSTTTNEISKLILTKSVGKLESEDITLEYKGEKGSDAEPDSEVLLRTLRRFGGAAFSRHLLNDAPQDVHFELTTVGDTLIGEPITIQLQATDKRTEGQEYLVQISFSVHSTLYTGKANKLVKRDEFEIQMGPGVENVMKMSVSYEEYSRCLLDQGAFLAFVSAHVQDTGFDFCAQEDFRLRMPDIDIQVDGDLVKGLPVTVTASFSNPLPRPLRSGEFFIEGLGKTTQTKIKRSVPVGGQAKAVCVLTPSSPGSKTVVAKFRSKELQDVEGHKLLQIKSLAEKDGGCHL